MNHLWTVVQQLTQLLEENRAQTQGIVNGVQAIHARTVEEGGLGGGNGGGEGNGGEVGCKCSIPLYALR